MPDPQDGVYVSHLTLSFGGSSPRPSSPSGTDADDEALRRLRHEVVEPVVRSIVRDDELTALRVYREGGAAPGEVSVEVVAGEDWFGLLLSSASWEGEQRWGPDRLAARLADALEDWVPETAFAWGQRRFADPGAYLRRDGEVDPASCTARARPTSPGDDPAPRPRRAKALVRCEPPVGIEPTTFSLRVRCSTD
jgi:hypothetical protein